MVFALWNVILMKCINVFLGWSWRRAATWRQILGAQTEEQFGGKEVTWCAQSERESIKTQSSLLRKSNQVWESMFLKLTIPYPVDRNLTPVPFNLEGNHFPQFDLVRGGFIVERARLKEEGVSFSYNLSLFQDKVSVLNP